MWETNGILLTHVVNAGVQPSYCSVTCQNSKYFAYSAFLSVYIIEQKTLKIVNMIIPNSTAVSTLALCNKRPDILAISYQDCTLQIIDVVNNTLLGSYTTAEHLVGLCWAPYNNILVGFSKTFDYLYTMNFDEGATLRKITGRFPNIRTIASTDKNGPYFVGGNDLGNVSLFDYVKGKVMEYKETKISTTKVCAVDSDPQSGAIVIIWREGYWALFDIEGKLILMNQNSKAISEFGACCWITDPPGHFITGDSQTGIIRMWNSSSTSPIESFSVHPLGFIALQRLKDNRVLCAFSDGMISVYDMSARKFIWKTNAAHRNTIFKLEFHPSEPNYVISCGAEGAVCTWDARNMNLLDRILPQSDLGHIYSMALTPGGGYVICGYNGLIAVFSNKSMQLMWQEKIAKGKIVHLSVSAVEPNLLLIGTLESGVFLYNMKDRTVLKTITDSNATVVGCCFNPHSKEKAGFAVSNNAGFVDIYPDYQSAPRRYYIGCFRLYSVDWSPHSPYILGCVADSGESVILDISKTDYVTWVAHKHNAIARAFAFHPTFPEIVASTGYDGRVAICDIVAKKELVVYYAHVAYIYGLAFSPVSPYLLMTSGTDTMIKQWSIDRLFTTKLINSVIKGEKLFLRPYDGANDLEKLSRRVARTAEGQLTFAPSDVIHINDVVRISSRLIKKLTTTSPTEGNRIKQAIKQRERLVQAANISLHCGDIKKYCELMFEAGERSKALMAAPAVSAEFWADMISKSAEMEENPKLKLAYLLASGKTHEAVNSLAESGDLQDAMLVSCAGEQGCFKQKIVQNEVKQSSTDKLPFEFTFTEEDRLRERQIGYKRSMNDLKAGKLYLAAADLLSVGDVESAILQLFNCGELIAAMYLNKMFEMPVDVVTTEFALLVINRGIQYDALKSFPKKVLNLVFNTIKFETDEEREKAMNDLGIEIPTDDSIESQIKKLLAKRDVSEAVKVAVDFIVPEIQKTKFDFCLLDSLVKLFEIEDLSKIEDELKTDIILCDYILCLYKSMWYGYDRQFPRLMKVINNLGQSRPWCAKMITQLGAMSAYVPKSPNATVNCVSSDVLNVLLVGYEYFNDLKYGPLMRLDDMETDISVMAMLEWKRMTRFSPLGNETRYIQF